MLMGNETLDSSLTGTDLVGNINTASPVPVKLNLRVVRKDNNNDKMMVLEFSQLSQIHNRLNFEILLWIVLGGRVI